MEIKNHISSGLYDTGQIRGVKKKYIRYYPQNAKYTAKGTGERECDRTKRISPGSSQG